MTLERSLIFYLSQRIGTLEDNILSNEKSMARLQALKEVTAISLTHDKDGIKNYTRSSEDIARLPRTLQNLKQQNEEMRVELSILKNLTLHCASMLV